MIDLWQTITMLVMTAALVFNFFTIQIRVNTTKSLQERIEELEKSGADEYPKEEGEPIT